MRVAGLLLAAALLVASCSVNGSNPGGAVVEGTEIERTTTTTIPPAPPLESTSTIPVELAPAEQITRNQTDVATQAAAWSWTGQRYDIGTISQIRPTTGRWLISFRRDSITQAGATRSGGQLTSEPIVVGKDSTQVKATGHQPLAFAVAADATVLQLNVAWSCGQDPDWLSTSMSRVADTGVGGDQIDTLTFDPSGQVAAVRLSRGC